MPAGFDKVRIANMALGHVGAEGSIESLDENSEVARIAKLWYDAARIATLEAYNWSFARKSKALATHSEDAPSTRWRYRYQYPVDCLNPRFIENPAGVTADAVPYEIENAGDGTRSIVTDLEDAVLVYTADVETVALFSMHFVIMCSYQLAVFINPQVTGKFGIADRMQRLFEQLRVTAPQADATSSVPREERDPSWIRER